MKAIETQYKGYRFRSRTEARWAVFFEALGVDWMYEPEGFVLEDATHYLPDFVIGSSTFVEIKGAQPTEEEIETCKQFGENQRILLLWGPPGKYKDGKRGYGLMYFEPAPYAEDGVFFGDDMIFGECRGRGKCKHINLGCYYPDRNYLDSGLMGLTIGSNRCHAKRVDVWAEGRVNEAAKIARSARFEHGETPQI